MEKCFTIFAFAWLYYLWDISPLMSVLLSKQKTHKPYVVWEQKDKNKISIQLFVLIIRRNFSTDFCEVSL
jgi:hypothetical protein